MRLARKKTNVFLVENSWKNVEFYETKFSISRYKCLYLTHFLLSKNC